MIKKNSLFYAGIIGLVMLPSQCLAMQWVLDSLPVSKIIEVATNVVCTPKKIIPWEKIGFQHALDRQNYSDIMPSLYVHVNDVEINTEVCEWIKLNAEAGDVAMMYLFLRNIHNALSNNVPVTKTDWLDAGKYLMISFICVYQDEMYCKKHSLIREQPQGFSEFLASSSYNGGDRYQREIIPIFIHKYAYWFKNYALEKHAPFANALQEAHSWFEKHSDTLHHPIWVKYCFGAWPSSTEMIAFETPHPLNKLLKKNRAKRDKFRDKAFELLSKMSSWFVFFTSSTNSNSQQNEDDSDSDGYDEITDTVSVNTVSTTNNASQGDDSNQNNQDDTTKEITTTLETLTITDNKNNTVKKT